MALTLCDPSQFYKNVNGLRRADIDSLITWCQMQRHLPTLTETQAINFLHSNNYSNEAAKRCIDDFYTVRTHSPEFFNHRNPRDINLKCFMYFPFKKRSPEGNLIMMGRLMDHNPDSWFFNEHIKIFDMSTMLYINREGPSNGIVYIHDLSGISLAHLTKLNLLGLKKFFFYLQECMPVKVKGLHFINTGNLMDRIMVLIRPFMKKDLLEVLHIHTSMDSIYKMFPKETFPNDFEGGCAPSIEEQQNKNIEDLMKNVKYFLAEEKQLVDEKKRAGKPKKAGDIFGVEGTFKKLEID